MGSEVRNVEIAKRQLYLRSDEERYEGSDDYAARCGRPEILRYRLANLLS
jgi:hypothetical protein